MARVEEVPDEPSSRAFTTATKTPSLIPLKRPDTTSSRKSEPLVSVSPPDEGTSTIQSKDGVAEDEEGSFAEEVFDTALMTVPFTFLFILLDVLVHMQYRHRPSIPGLLNRLLTAVPTLAITLFYTNRHSKHFLTHSLLMSASVLSGMRLIWLVNKASWSLTTEQAPAMGTIWILTIVQLPLSRALLSLGVVSGWVWWTGMKLKT